MLTCVTVVASMAVHAAEPYHPSTEEVLRDLSRRSGVSPTELQRMLSDCELNQLNMNFCAYRDAVVADLQLRHAAEQRIRQQPECQTSFDKQLDAWRKSMVDSCEKSSTRKFAGGSMRPMVAAACQADETNAFRTRVNKPMRDCKISRR